MNTSDLIRKKIAVTLICFSGFISSSAFAFSEFDGICGDTWHFTTGKYNKYYADFFKKSEEYRRQCDSLGSMTDAHFACGRKVQLWYEQTYSAIQAKEKADGENHDAKRLQCINQQKTLRGQQEARDRELKQQQQVLQRQEQLQRQANEQALAQSNAERAAYNRAAEERTRQAQEQDETRQRIYAAQQAESNRQAQIQAQLQAQQQAEIVAAQQRSEAQLRGAIHDMSMQSLQQSAQNS